MNAAMLLLLIWALTCCVGNALAAAAFVQGQSGVVSFESRTFAGQLWTPLMPPPSEGKPVTVTGTLALPATKGIAPAVILLHGCGGVSAAETEWAAVLNSLGFATFVVNSFAGRNIAEACSGRAPIHPASVLTDAFRALELLANHPSINPTQVALMGGGLGGHVVLWSSQVRFQERYALGARQFAAYLALYPASCHVRLADEERTAGGPIRIFHGSSDTWTPAEPCRDYVRRLQKAGKDAALFEYADAPHAFDQPSTPRTLPDALSFANCAFVERQGRIVDPATNRDATIDAPCVTRGATLGPKPEAHQQALKDVRALLESVFR